VRLPKSVIGGFGVLGALLTILSLPSVPQEVANWGPVLSAVNSEPLRWLLPTVGWLLVAGIVIGLWSGQLRSPRREGHVEIGEIHSRTIDRGPVRVISVPHHGSDLALEGRNSRRQALAALFKEGDDLRSECAGVPDGSPEEKLRWQMLGGTPQAQCAREDEARSWDQKVSDYLWAEPELKHLAPGWRPAGEPIETASDHPNQSMMNPARLASWYSGKLDCLGAIIEQASD
jgi:hypothetical protein